MFLTSAARDWLEGHGILPCSWNTPEPEHGRIDSLVAALCRIIRRIIRIAEMREIAQIGRFFPPLTKIFPFPKELGEKNPRLLSEPGK